MDQPASDPRLREIQEQLRPLRKTLAEHPLYGALRSIEDVRIFMEHHVFAVWDFMSLLKWLQRQLTCVDIPWLPSPDAMSRRLINEIVLAEESDEDGRGGYASHLETYLAAMEQCGASTEAVQILLNSLRPGVSVPDAAAAADAPPAARRFLAATWELIEAGQPHCIAANFALAREDLIPEMFRAIIADLDRRFGGQLSVLRDYLERHIAVDEEHHTPLALRMLARQCGEDPQKWQQAAEAAQGGLHARIRLWNAVYEQLRENAEAA